LPAFKIGWGWCVARREAHTSARLF
jgi:hypothetical protein